ncbi:MAG: peptidoglycan-associated lipoprotein Pal [Proteobacteria bacterium]|nr:peptidoglycan-associated lipoprotein Pal [Pseudomonadota bacterium]
MKQYFLMSRLSLAGIVVLLVSSCATTQELPIQDDGADQQLQGEVTAAEGTIAEDTDSAAATAISDEPLTAQELLEQSDTPLANRTIYFEFDSAKLTDEALSILETHGNFVAGNGNVSVRLEGHGDERGSREYNIALGDRRAQSARRVLLFQGAAIDQIDTVSYGEEQPAMLGHTEEAWARNRRVEIIYRVN